MFHVKQWERCEGVSGGAMRNLWLFLAGLENISGIFLKYVFHRANPGMFHVKQWNAVRISGGTMRNQSLAAFVRPEKALRQFYVERIAIPAEPGMFHVKHCSPAGKKPEPHIARKAHLC